MQKIKRQKRDNSVERQIAIGCIVSSTFLRELRAMYKPEYIASPYAKKIVNWCLSYYAEYEKAPARDIQSIYESRKRKDLDEDTADIIADFLADISDEYERADHFNAQYVLDQTTERFKARALEMLSQDIDASLSEGKVDEAETAYQDFKSVERLSGVGIDPFKDTEALYHAFEEAPKPLFTFPGELGKMINSHLVRDSFNAFLGPEKRGKSWWLKECAMRAAKARCNVAFFSVGDMSQDQMMRRIFIGLAQKSDRQRYCGTFLRPVLDCRYNQINDCALKDRACKNYQVMHDEVLCEYADRPKKYKPCTACREEHSEDFAPALWFEEITIDHPLTAAEASAKAELFNKRIRGRHFKLYTCANSTINVEGIDTILDQWENEGIIFDVVVIDYADILAPEVGESEFRHQQDARWKALRRLSQERHCCVITATQADAKSYDKETISLSNFSEDKRKYAHATAFWSLNQSEEEKRQKLIRIASLLVREDEFDSNDTVTVLQCLQQGIVYIDSYKKKRIIE